MSNRTAPPVKVRGDKLVIEERKSGARNRTVSRYLVLLTLAPAASADALPMRSLFTDPASATGEVIPYFARGLRDTHIGSNTQLLDPASGTRAAYQRRIDQLRSFAEEDGIALSSLSEDDFFDFACNEPQTRAASLVLLDNGNLRAVWRSGQQEVGVQFYGGGSVQYLISREGDDGKITHTARRGTFEEFSAAIEGAGLGGLLYE
ncbi:MAG: hypothetical protein OXU81_22360 [Gammaproteobacteria bacterium]|nr:hypothetical protein [Gammaproteobacteria bacterium]